MTITIEFRATKEGKPPTAIESARVIAWIIDHFADGIHVDAEDGVWRLDIAGIYAMTEGDVV